MDACEHEYPSMSRHNRKVPTSFYHRFTEDARVFAEKYSSGRLISVLEGGYSDRALISGSMAHVCGLAGSDKVEEEWWNIENLTEVSSSIAHPHSSSDCFCYVARESYQETTRW